jgi:large subunit ribosomal protein L7/L12
MSVSEMIRKAVALPQEEQDELLIQLIDQLSVPALNALLDKVEQRFGVKGRPEAPVFMPPPVEQAPPPVEEKTEWVLWLLSGGEKRVNVIREVRGMTGVGLIEAKALVEQAPVALKKFYVESDATAAKALLEAAGGKAEVRS